MRYLLLVTALLAGCAQPAKEAPKPDPAAIRKAIETSNAAQTAAMVKGDIAGAIAPYTADAVVFNPGSPMVTGPAEIQKMFEGMLAAVTIKEFTLTVSDVIVAGSGELAVEHGRYRWTIQPKGGKTMLDSGKYVVAWQKQADGGWKITRDILNTDIPPKM